MAARSGLSATPAANAAFCNFRPPGGFWGHSGLPAYTTNTPIMNTLIRSSLVAASLALATSGFAKEPSAGHVDFTAFASNPDGQVVEVKVDSGLLKFAAKVAAAREPEAAEIIRNIESVRVNVVELSEANAADATAKINGVRTQLESAGWAPTVKVRDPKKGEDVAVYIKSGAADTIEGIVVTVIESGKQAVFVNVVGNLRPEQLGELGKRLDLPVLKRPELKAEAPAATQT